MNRPIAALQPLARTGDHVATAGDVATAATAATDWAGFAPVAHPCYLANAANFSGLALACTMLVSRGTIQPKAKAPACEDALGKVVAAPTVSGVLSCLNSWGTVIMAAPRMVYGRGGGYPQGRPHGFTRVFNRHAHPLRVKTHPVVLKSRKGATMHRPTVASRSAAPVSKAAPATSTPTSTSTEAQAFALLQAVTSINLAGFYVRRDNVAQARRKLRQALQALNAMEVAHA